MAVSYWHITVGAGAIIKLIVFSVQCTVYTVYSVQCTVYSVQYTVYSVQCTVYILQYTLYSVQCTVYSVHCTVYSIQCKMYSVQCTVYSVQCVVYCLGQHPLIRENEINCCLYWFGEGKVDIVYSVVWSVKGSVMVTQGTWSLSLSISCTISLVGLLAKFLPKTEDFLKEKKRNINLRNPIFFYFRCND